MYHNQGISDKMFTKYFARRRMEPGKARLIWRSGQKALSMQGTCSQWLYAVESDEDLDLLRQCAQDVGDASVAFIMGYDRGLCWRRPTDGKSYGPQDVKAALTSMLTSAYNLGLGASLVTNFEPLELAALFSIPETVTALTILCVGYPLDMGALAVPTSRCVCAR